MRVPAPLFLLACLMIFNASGYPAEEQQPAAEYGESHTAFDDKESAMDIPPGMELRKIGSMSMIVPLGTQVSKKSSLVIMEGPDEYAARNIYEMKGRLMTLEARQHDLEKKFNDLREIVLKMQKKPEAEKKPEVEQ